MCRPKRANLRLGHVEDDIVIELVVLMCRIKVSPLECVIRRNLRLIRLGRDKSLKQLAPEGDELGVHIGDASLGRGRWVLDMAEAPAGKDRRSESPRDIKNQGQDAELDQNQESGPRKSEARGPISELNSAFAHESVHLAPVRTAAENEITK